MTIHQAPFGSYKGKAVTAFTLINANGLTARLISFGARLMEMHVPDRTGRLADIVLGFDDLASYAATDTYFGATVGRYGNRIKNGRFALEGEPLEVTRNEPPNHLHGGAEGFDRKVWDAYPNESETSVTFSLVSPSGEEGFPGQVSVTSKYTLTDDNRLVIVLSGLTDAPTILNMVHHSYWNVAGHDSGDICDQLLTVDADFYTPVDDELMPTGEVLTVKDSLSQKQLGGTCNQSRTPVRDARWSRRPATIITGCFATTGRGCALLPRSTIRSRAADCR
jgi:aldose 1-epimerase